MWALLANPGHAESFDYHGVDYAPLPLLVEQLASREYANRVYVVKSLATFILTMAPTYIEDTGHDSINIQYNPDRSLFDVSYCEWLSPTRNPPHRIAAKRTCEPAEVGEIIDRYVLRLLLFRRC